ncbi:MAG: SDR family NAD(P)-dependent oxidoreductase [Acidimicrobiales bacterium]
MRTDRFTHQRAIVTGAGQGIGLAIAEALAVEGAEVMLVGRRAEPLKVTAARIVSAGGEAWPYQADVSSVPEIDSLVAAAGERWGAIDVVVNNAGVAEEVPFLEVTEEGFDAVVDTNLKGAFFMAQRAARLMAERGGAIVHIASIDAFGADGPYSSYVASKAGLLGLTRSMATELAPHGIRVNAVSPGFVHTTMTEHSAGSGTMAYLLNRFDRVPIRRLITTAEIASAVLYLASAEASATTGANLTVDGGLTSNLYIFESIPGTAES